MNRRVAVTGLGAVTPLAVGVEPTWKGIIEGKSGIGKIQSMDTEGFSVSIGGEVPDFDPTSVVEKSTASPCWR